MRRLPIYLLIDASESMRGAPLDTVLEAVCRLLSDLRQDPRALETAYLSVIAFGGNARQLAPLTDLTEFQVPVLEAGGECTLGAAFEKLLSCAERELVARSPSSKGDFKPLVFLMTNGCPTDEWKTAADRVKSKRWALIACAPDCITDESLLKYVRMEVVNLKDCSRDELPWCVSRMWLEDDGPVFSADSVRLMDDRLQRLPAPPPGSAIVDAGRVPMGNVASRTEKAILADGREVEYVVDLNKPLWGGMTDSYFTPDKTSVVSFFKDQSDAARKLRIEKMLHQFNPTIDPLAGDYWKQLFNWPTAIVTAPRLGVVVPAIPAHFFFRGGPWSGKLKEPGWFVRNTASGGRFRDMLPESERGNWANSLRGCIQLAKAMWCLHRMGCAIGSLCLADFLFDPIAGQIMLRRWEDIIVPGIFPPDIVGTRGYIAPEELATMHLMVTDPRRKHPSAETNRYSLAVLIYQLLLLRHPLEGPRLNSTISAEEDELLTYGDKALFVEHPTDRSNRPDDSRLGVPYEALGPHLVNLFNQAFVDGLHAPNLRPIAAAWISALLKTWDLLHPCPNASCSHKWFVLHDPKNIRCPFCETVITGPVYRMRLRKESRPGQWMPDGEAVLYNGKNLHRWHVFDDVANNERLKPEEKKPVADIQAYQGAWLFINRAIDGLMSPSGNRVPPGQAIELKHGMTFRLSSAPHGRVAVIEMMYP
jgi:uncharacterized protein YegL